MNSVKASHAGIASGINNAVSRTAGLLAIAVLGVVMFHSFNSCLDDRLNQMAIPPEIRRQLDTQRIRLAAMDVPSTAASEIRTMIRYTVEECFVSGFRQVTLIGVALAFASSIAAALTLGRRKSAKAPETTETV
jgi:hypothetical protein